MTRQQMINRINEIVNEYLGGGVSGLYGIRSHSRERLNARLTAYETMILLHQTYVSLMNDIPVHLQNGLALGWQNEWTEQYEQATAFRRQAQDIWIQSF